MPQVMWYVNIAVIRTNEKYHFFFEWRNTLLSKELIKYGDSLICHFIIWCENIDLIPALKMKIQFQKRWKVLKSAHVIYHWLFSCSLFQDDSQQFLIKAGISYKYDDNNNNNHHHKKRDYDELCWSENLQTAQHYDWIFSVYT